MAKIDEIKEELNYLKVWLSITVLTIISLIAWLLNNYEVTALIKVVGSLVSIIILTISVIIIDKNIKEKIKKLRDL